MSRLFPILLAYALGACGGEVDGDGAGSGGQAGSAGGAGSSGNGGNGSCERGGTIYENGESIDDGCNMCTCAQGEWLCTRLYCGNEQCTYGKLVYDRGESFPANDGCNTCTCQSAGVVSCTTAECGSCEDIESSSGLLVEQAKVCDPQAPNQCTQVVSGQLICGCPTYVNPENEEAIAGLAATHAEHSALMCGPSPCDCASPSGAFCSPDGQCVDVYGSLASCQVNGEIHPSGSSGFPGPLGCHTCSCDDGVLGCTEEDCPSACPPNAVDGSHCAQCGPDDGCEVVEYKCLEVCGGDTCQTGDCIDGVCKNVCG